MDEAVKYAKERKQFGKPISKFQNTQFQLADLADQASTAAKLAGLQRCHGRRTTSSTIAVDAAMAKLFAAETAMRCHHQGRAVVRRLRLHP